MQFHPEYPLDPSPTAEPVDLITGKPADPYRDLRAAFADPDVSRGPNRAQRRARTFGRLK